MFISYLRYNDPSMCITVLFIIARIGNILYTHQLTHIIKYNTIIKWSIIQLFRKMKNLGKLMEQ